MYWPVDGFNDIKKCYFPGRPGQPVATGYALVRDQDAPSSQVLENLGQELSRDRFSLCNGVNGTKFTGR